MGLPRTRAETPSRANTGPDERPTSGPGLRPADMLLRLQATGGNQMVLRMVDTGSPIMVQRTPESEARLAEIEQQLGTFVISDEYRAELEGERQRLLSAGNRSGAGASHTPAGPVLPPSGSVSERVAAFKTLVKTVAVQRLTANRRNLTQWSQLIEQTIPESDLAVVGLAQSGGADAYAELQGMHDPMMRELRATQAIGHNRACTGCHLANYAWGTRDSRAAAGGREWMSPNEQRMSMAGYQPAPGSSEARLNHLLGSPGQAASAMRNARPILEALGPQGYGVLPATILMELEHGSADQVRARIRSAIAERSQGYADLVSRIQSGDMGYEHFGPVVTDLLAMADAEVRGAIQREMDDNRFWARVEAIVVGALSIAALLLAIFPPTSVVGIAAAGALEMSLGVYGSVRGAQAISTGAALSDAAGADDVVSRQQQEAAAGMMLSGFFGVVLAPVSVASGASRMASAVSVEARIVGLTTGQAVQRGRYLLTLHDDGSVVATIADRPDILIILRNGEATAYQVTGTGLRVLETRPIASASTAAESAQPLALPAPSSVGPVLPNETAAATAAQEAFQVARFGGPLPQETRAVGAAIIEVEGYTGPRTVRAISSAQTDELGIGAAVVHAPTPATRTLPASQMIGGSGGGAPVSHVNDAEIKLFELLRRSGIPRDARGTVYLATWRSRAGGAQFEPLPMCASCTNASFHMKGDFPNITFVSLTPPRGAQRIIDLEAAGLVSPAP